MSWQTISQLLNVDAFMERWPLVSLDVDHPIPFGTMRCDCCGSDLAGERWRFTAKERPDDTVAGDGEVCGQCAAILAEGGAA